ncbi:hypothetical protein CR513_46267, partial [Mucuna pruriens]
MFINNYSRFDYLYLIHEKSQSLDVFNSFKVEKIKVIKSGCGGEYYGRYDGSGEQRLGPFAPFLKEYGDEHMHCASMCILMCSHQWYHKFIYGLKQASHQWYHKFHQVIISYGFETNVVDDCVYHKFSGNKYIFLVLYVDDILLAIVIQAYCMKSRDF